jgi:hypothetical protein
MTDSSITNPSRVQSKSRKERKRLINDPDYLLTNHVIPTGVKQYPIVTRPRQSKFCPGLRNQQGCHPERAK